MSVSTFKRAVQAGDWIRVVDGVRRLRAEGMTDAEVYRLALAADGSLTRAAWDDQVGKALEQNEDPFTRIEATYRAQVQEEHDDSPVARDRRMRRT